MPALGRAVRGLGAATTLLVLLVGVPALLALAVGWPLPRALPAWEEVTGTFRGDLPLDATTVWKVLACVVWVAWAQILVATVVEAAALAHGGVAAPIRGLAHMQGMAGSLLGTVVLLLPGIFARQAPVYEAPSIATARTLVAYTAVSEAPSVELSRADDPAPPEGATIEHTVVRRDTLWDLAERYLAPGGSVGDVSAAVQQLFELNQGRPQHDGSALTDASLLRPGWVLRIPVRAAMQSAASTVTVVPGDSLWEIAEDHLGDGHRYPEIFDLNAGRPQPDGEALGEPAHIEPGWQLEVPPVASVPPPVPTPAAPTTPSPPAAPPVAPPAPPAPPTTTPATPPTPTTAATTHDSGAPATTAAPVAPSSADQATVPGESADDDEATTSTIGVLGVAGGLLATGLGTVLAFRRRRQLALRRPRTEPPPMPETAAAVLDDLAEVDLDYSLGVDRTLRQLGDALGSRSTVPVPIVATLDGSNIDLLLDRSDSQPPEPWRAVADGLIWRAQVEPRTDEPDAGPAWLPAFVSIGALDTGGLLLNLEAVGAVAVVGETPAIALARSFVAELAMTPLADVAAIHVVGNVIGDVTNLPRVRHHDDLGGALAAAEEDTAVISGALAGAGTPNAVELRCRARDEAWGPAVVVAPTTAAAPDGLARLLERCHEGAGVVAVLIGPCPPGALEVRVSAEEVTIPALGLSCAPQQLAQEALETISEVLDLTDEVCIEPADDTPLTLFTPTELGDTDEAGGEPNLHLYLLGPARLEGTEISPQQLSLVAYLALHPDATADAVRDAIWGGKTPTRERFLNTMHELRRVVGADVLPSSTDGHYRLRRVWCDLVEVERLVAAAKANPDERAAHLRAVLELVAGSPLTFESRHRRHFKWIDFGNHASRWERIVGDAAHDLAQLALDQGDTDLARWAAERGLLASPASQTLTCDLISAHLAAGDRNAAEHVVDAYGRVLEDLGYDETPEELQELLESRRAS